MPILVNGEPVAEELIEHEAARLIVLPGFQAIPDEQERSSRVHALAECAVVDRILIRQIAEIDESPIDPAELDQSATTQLPGYNRKWGGIFIPRELGMSI